MTEQTESTAERDLGSKLLVGLLLAAVAFFGFTSGEVFAYLHGAGYGHRALASWVSGVLYLGITAVATLGIMLVLRRRRRLIYEILLVMVLGIVIAFISGWMTMFSLPAHYERVCDTAEAPRACSSGSSHPSCVAGDDEACFRRLERSCDLGSVKACDRLVERDTMSEAQVCDTLKNQCERTRRCDAEPDSCGRDELPSAESAVFEGVCEAYESRCS